MIAIGLIGTISKLHKWDESAMFFDGSSLGTLNCLFAMSNLMVLLLAAYVFSIAIYLTVTIPALRTIVTPIEGETRQIRKEALSVLSAGNTIIAVCLVGVLVLQVQINTPKKYYCRMFRNNPPRSAGRTGVRSAARCESPR
jgi:hypothetical protein